MTSRRPGGMFADLKVDESGSFSCDNQINRSNSCQGVVCRENKSASELVPRNGLHGFDRARSNQTSIRRRSRFSPLRSTLRGCATGRRTKSMATNKGIVEKANRTNRAQSEVREGRLNTECQLIAKTNTGITARPIEFAFTSLSTSICFATHPGTGPHHTK